MSKKQFDDQVQKYEISQNYSEQNQYLPKITVKQESEQQIEKKHTQNLFENLSQKQSLYDKQIQIDIERTWVNNERISETQSKILFRVLRAYANLDKEIGYSQGMSMVVSGIYNSLEFLLTEQKLSEDSLAKKVFWLFYYICYILNWKEEKCHSNYQAVSGNFAFKRHDDQTDKCMDFNCYEMGEKLGSGAFAQVRKIYRYFQEFENGPILKWPYACKILKKSKLQSLQLMSEDEDGIPNFIDGLDQLRQELDIYQYLNHKNICKLFEILIDEDELSDFPDQIFLIMQYCNLGEIMEWQSNDLQFVRNQKIMEFIMHKHNIGIGQVPGLSVQKPLGIIKQTQFSILKLPNQYQIERIAKVLFKQVLQGIQYLHKHNIANRDIKPQNILFKSYDETKDGYIKIADFSTAKMFENKDQKTDQNCGTPGFQSPEMVRGDEYNPFKNDIFAFGVTLYSYICEKLPWDLNRDSQMTIDQQLENAVLKQQIKFNDNIFSQEVQEIINLCCQKQEKLRPDADELIQYKWFQQ
ncbi:Rab-GTPase-TBC domain [Pseudocohnilembus persalinus]|uniref:Rab-GTPase-TBC domain n=1 Tax=Pseudocohnilembus persalinus TaxID=266149 RepID=A0A0V0R195_PSEPJ|nr:Rab-GTPase-TBC domain [Pseudocohnilembus persalinus]|eukprot:KRX08302.1 Rab-GTPase-TBC domain [Pseudocohnilembus persalinus]